MDQSDRGYRGASASDEFTFNTCLASLHTYLGEVEDTHHRLAFLDGGAILTLPLFYLEGVVLFPEATLPLRVIQPNFIAAVERALSQGDALYTIGVVHVYRDPDNQRTKFATVGTTAEIRQYRRLEDGSLNVVTRGQQRFRLRRRWNDVEGAACGEVQIIQEDLPLRTPRDAFGKLAPLSGQSLKGEGRKKGWMVTELNQSRRASRAFWPYWVYRMYDSYCLAQRVADMWKQIVGTPKMDGLLNGLVKKPDLLSFYIASKIPVSESIRQELLEIDGISYRLRREIELLESFDRIRCKNCQTVIARRSDMLVMSSDGPLGAYVNPSGCVHEIMTLFEADGLALVGHAIKEYSWFPGYAWTITICATCKTQMGWLFTATNKKLKPRSFWGIRSSQVADDMR